MSKNIERIYRFLDSSEEAREMYNKSPYFHQAVGCLLRGDSPEEVVLLLCRTLEEQQKTVANMVLDSNGFITIKKEPPL